MRPPLLLAAALMLGACVTPSEPVATIPRPLPEADPAIFLAVVPQSDRTRPSMGSAFLVSPSLLVSNRHVVDGAHEGRVLLTNRGRTPPLEGRVIWVSNGRYNTVDLAVIELAAPLNDVKPLALAPAPTVGQRVAAAGYPARSDYPGSILAMTAEGLAAETPPSARRLGTVVSVQSEPGGRWFETTSIVVGGISGGPMLDGCGRVMGIATRFRFGDDRQNSTLAQLTAVIEQELDRLRPAALTRATSPCATPLPDGTIADADGQALAMAPWPAPNWLPPGYRPWLQEMQGSPTAPGRVSSLAIDRGWRAVYSAPLAPDVESADRMALELCEIIASTACRTISRSIGAPISQTPVAPQPRLARRSTEFVASEVPFLLPAETAWLGARFAERDASRTAVVVHPWLGGFVQTSGTAEEALGHAVADCRRSAGSYRDHCFVYWTGAATVPEPFTLANNTGRLRATMVDGQPLDADHTHTSDFPRDIIERYARSRSEKAMAGDGTRDSVRWASERSTLADAERISLEMCEYHADRPCRLLARNDVALLATERALPRPQPRLEAPALPALPFVDTAFAESLAKLARDYTAAGEAWALALHPSGALRLANAATQADADTAALGSCRERTARVDPTHCRIVLRGDGRPAEPFRMLAR